MRQLKQKAVDHVLQLLDTLLQVLGAVVTRWMLAYLKKYTKYVQGTGTKTQGTFIVIVLRVLYLLSFYVGYNSVCKSEIATSYSSRIVVFDRN